MKIVNIIGIAWLVTGVAVAKDLAIIGATVHTMGPAGKIDNATLIIRNGKIQSIQAGLGDVSGLEVIHAENKIVTPGFIGAKTQLGLVDVGFSAGTNDSTIEQNSLSAIGAAYDVSYALNADSSLMAVSRIAGITSAATSLSDSRQLFSGQGAFISLADNLPVLIKGRAFLTTQVGNAGADVVGGSRSVVWSELNAVLSEAEFAKGKVINPMDEWHGLMSKADVEALIPVIKGEIPLLIDARRKADIEQVINLKQRFPKLRIVILYATEGWRVAGQLAENKIPVILDPESNLPYEFDQLAATMSNAGRLDKAGVKVAIGMETHNIRLSRQHAGNAVANGLPWDKGLAALTINVAQIFAVDTLVGSIEPGKRADVVIWSGDPLEVTEAAEQVLIGGEAVKMQSRQTKLRDRYLHLNLTKPHQFVRP